MIIYSQTYGEYAKNRELLFLRNLFLFNV